MYGSTPRINIFHALGSLLMQHLGRHKIFQMTSACRNCDISTDRQSGLTLLEILVSVAILTVLLAAVYGTYTSNVEAVQVARSNSKVYQTARIVLDRMIKDLESALIEVPLSVEGMSLGMIGKNQEINDMEADTLDFTSLAHVSLASGRPQTDLCEIGYSLIKDPDDEGMILYRREDWSLDEDFTGGGLSHELARMVTGLDIVFHDNQGKEYNEWHTLEEKQVNALPTLINIRLTMKDQTGRQKVFTTSVHPMLAELKLEE